MFELQVALKYLIPKRKALSVSIISLISVLVISLVVWLILVFFSVTNGLEEIWTRKLISVTAPLRVTPTDAYYGSYYYQIDKVSEESNFSGKTIPEKWSTSTTDPFDPQNDEPLPAGFAVPDKNSHGEVKDLVKELMSSLGTLKGVKASYYETAVASLKLNIQSEGRDAIFNLSGYLVNYDPDFNPFRSTLLPLEVGEFQRASRKNPELIGVKENSTPETIYALFNSRQQKEPIFLPKSYREAGVQIGDRGEIAYEQVTPLAVEESRLPVVVAGFYDPGIVPIGGKLIFASPELISMVNASYTFERSPQATGLNVYYDDLKRTDQVKSELTAALEAKGIAEYWHLETFKEYFFTKDLMQQLQSEKLLFSLISIVIIAVACSNIVSMLIILVNDKKKEIGILRSMGASSASIALIFGLCGFVMGVLGSLIGIAFAYLTLKNLELIVSFISFAQGHELFNARFFGETLPTEMSAEALLFVLLSTLTIALISGIVPALKACSLKPSQILRSE